MILCQIQIRQIVLWCTCHQNIRGLLNKKKGINKFLVSKFSPGTFTEHHLTASEIDFTYMDQYNLGTKFCRKSFKNCGVSIFVHDTP